MRINNAYSPLPLVKAAKCDCIYTREAEKKITWWHTSQWGCYIQIIVNLLQCKMDKKRSVHRWKKKWRQQITAQHNDMKVKIHFVEAFYFNEILIGTRFFLQIILSLVCCHFLVFIKNMAIIPGGAFFFFVQFIPWSSYSGCNANALSENQFIVRSILWIKFVNEKLSWLKKEALNEQSLSRFDGWWNMW